jgi:hypothetical protein
VRILVVGTDYYLSRRITAVRSGDLTVQRKKRDEGDTEVNTGAR